MQHYQRHPLYHPFTPTLPLALFYHPPSPTPSSPLTITPTPADDGTSAFIRESAPECTAPIPDGFAAAAVEAAMQLAVSMPDDATRKPLVHKCLMATRSVLKRPRVLGIECVARIADR